MSPVPQQPSPKSLTPRQIDVLREAATGKNNKAIGRVLYLTEDTVKTHMRRAFTALGVRNRLEAVLEAQRRGLFDRKEPGYTGPERRGPSRGRRRSDSRNTHPSPSRP